MSELQNTSLIKYLSAHSVSAMAIASLTTWIIVGCASSTKDKPQPRAHPAAYLSEDMTFNNPPPEHPPWQPTNFYFKKCAQTTRPSYFSKTSYECEHVF